MSDPHPSWLDQRLSDSLSRCTYEEERLVVEANEVLLAILDEKHMSRAQLASAIGTTRANMSGLLSGNRNMTLRTIARLAFMCGKRVEMRLLPLES